MVYDQPVFFEAIGHSIFEIHVEFHTSFFFVIVPTIRFLAFGHKRHSARFTTTVPYRNYSEIFKLTREKTKLQLPTPSKSLIGINHG